MWLGPWRPQAGALWVGKHMPPADAASGTARQTSWDADLSSISRAHQGAPPPTPSAAPMKPPPRGYTLPLSEDGRPPKAEPTLKYLRKSWQCLELVASGFLLLGIIGAQNRDYIG